MHLDFCTKTIWTFLCPQFGSKWCHIKAPSSYPPNTNSAIFSSVTMPRIRPPDGSSVCGTAWEIFILTFASLLLSGGFVAMSCLSEATPPACCMLHARCQVRAAMLHTPYCRVTACSSNNQQPSRRHKTFTKDFFPRKLSMWTFSCNLTVLNEF